MNMIEKIEQAVAGSVLQMKFEGQKTESTKNLEMIEYVFKFFIPPDWCIQDVQFTISQDLVQRLELIAEHNDLTLRRDGSHNFIFFKIKNISK